MVSWRKSSYSDGEQGACVELAWLGRGEVGVRDSKWPERGYFSMRAAELGQLLARIRRGS
ncbi:DUF397 domain-containing protein [Spirillospora sp. NPDC049652]